ncbi:MAG: hypothetical protein WBB45_17715 [Cyclobacteriaceae bacterium]
MESKFNDKAGESYSRLAAAEIADEHFRRHDFISGKEILELTPIRQINLFVVKHMFSQWQTEADKLRSPYFDYDSDDVRGAMDNLMNTLSRHIKMGRSHFEPLLRLAVNDALHLIFDPDGFYRSEVAGLQGSWMAEELKDYFKYFRINRFTADSLLHKAQSTSSQSIPAARVMDMLNEAIAEGGEQPEPTEGYLEQFNRIAPIREDQLVSRDNEERQEQEIHVESSPPNEETKGSDKIAEEQKSIYQQYEKEMTTVHDRLKTTDEEVERPSIHQGSRVESLRQSLTINQRFMFKNSLFGGDEEFFNNTLSELDRCDTMREARQYLSGNVVNKQDWDDDSEEAEEFYMVLQRRYN